MIDPPPTSAMTGRAGRVLVLLLAYNAERHICGVLERIPGELLNSGEVHFLVLDDASGDAGVDAALRWVAERDVTNVTVLRNSVNQGYGGNQKLGFRLALDCSFDFAVLLHADGQYSPTLLPDLIEVWRRTGADVILGTRMWSTALRGEVECRPTRTPATEF
jgi:glycosyltransferase involved in cell wall biosynthesis